VWASKDKPQILSLSDRSKVQGYPTSPHLSLAS
jgi:hypothetical protein